MEREMEEEMAFHLELETRKLLREGVRPDEAAREARRRFGDPMREKERARGAWGIGLVQDIRADALHTLRSLRRNPVFSFVVILTLALGIGGTTAIFSVVNGVLLKPLPYQDPGTLVSVFHADETYSGPYPLSPAHYFTFREHARTLSNIGVWRESQVTITGLDQPERVLAIMITDGVLPVLGVEPALGRGYTEEDVSPGSTRPIILTYGYWQRRFGGEPDILGRSLLVDGNALDIVGVMPPTFRFPGLEPDILLPLVFDRTRIAVGNFSFPAIARLRTGITVAEATRELDGLTELAAEEFGGIPLERLRTRNFTSLARPLRDTVVGSAATALLVVLGTAGIVLLIACANVANLYLVRTEARQRDLALRAAMGASRGRLARQFLTESVLVGLVGGSFGLLLALGGISALLSLAPPGIPRLEDIGLDHTVLLFTLGVSVTTGLLFGAIPVFRRGWGRLAGLLKDGGRSSSTGRRRFRVRTFFAVSQVALALVLLVASGLMIRTFQALLAVPPGFENPQEVLTFRLAVPPSEVPDVDEATLTFQTILERIQRIPGVSSTSGAASVAMDGWESWDDWAVEDHPLSEGESSPSRRINWMVPGYHRTLQNRLLAGRSLEWADIYERHNVALVTENFARQYWDEPARAVGRRIRNSASSPWREIVGVVGDVHTRGVAVEAPFVVYLPFITEQFWGTRSFCVRELRLVVRTDHPDPSSLLPQIREAVWSVNANLALADIKPLDRIFGDSMARTSLTVVTLGIAAAVALILGLVGVYGTISFIVSQRTREMGVRLALGASRRQVSFMVLRQGGVIAVLGAALGLGAAVGLTRLMSSLLFRVNPVDLPTYTVVSGALLGVVLLASYVPAHRAASVDPNHALRWD